VIEQTMRRLRADPPPSLLDAAVTFEDLAPDADVVRLTFAGGRVVVRPSGTEPKLKAYLEVVEPSGSAGAAAARMAQLRDEVAGLVTIS
jgi:phosphomannomutase